MSATAGFGRGPGYAAPRRCPVCGDALALTRLGCRSCGSELSGTFEACEYCSLGAADRDMLAVFLASRGNMKELERHLGVSYPTARARFEALLGRLGLVGADEPGASGGDEPGRGDDPGRTDGPGRGGTGSTGNEVDVLVRLARGEIDVDEAERLMGAT